MKLSLNELVSAWRDRHERQTHDEGYGSDFGTCADELEAALACDAQPEGDYRKARGVLSVVGDSTSAEESIRRARGNTPTVRRPSREQIAKVFFQCDVEDGIWPNDWPGFNDKQRAIYYERADAVLALFDAEPECKYGAHVALSEDSH